MDSRNRNWVLESKLEACNNSGSGGFCFEVIGLDPFPEVAFERAGLRGVRCRGASCDGQTILWPCTVDGFEVATAIRAHEKSRGLERLHSAMVEADVRPPLSECGIDDFAPNEGSKDDLLRAIRKIMVSTKDSEASASSY